MPSAARNFPYYGSTEPMAYVSIYRDAGVLSTTTQADANGNYAGDIGGLAEGSYSFYAVARKSPKHESQQSDPVSIVVTPNPPVIVSPASGYVATGPVTLYMTVEAGYLNVFDNGILIQGPTMQQGGIGYALAPILFMGGAHSVTASVTGFVGGGVSDLSNAVDLTVFVPLPVVTDFAVPATTNVLNVPVTTFTATAPDGINGYLITTSATPPLYSNPGWSPTAPTTYHLTADGAYTLYAWVLDNFQQVSDVFPGQPVTKVTVGTPMEAVKGDVPTYLYEMDENGGGVMVDTMLAVDGAYNNVGTSVNGQYPPSLAVPVTGAAKMATINSPGGLASVGADQPFSIEFVVYGNPKGVGNATSFVMSDVSNVNQNNGFRWLCSTTQHYVTVQYTGFQTDAVGWLNDFNANGWNHCVLTCDGLGAYRVYVNGVEKTPTVTPAITAGLSLIHGGPLELGGTTTSPPRPIQAGVLWDYLAFWIGTELTPTQALEHYTGRPA